MQSETSSGSNSGVGSSTSTGASSSGSHDTTGDVGGDSGSSGSSDSGDVGPSPPINHIQAKGTHNSYHVAPASSVPFWAYTMAPLDVQLDEQGVRQFELDVHFVPGEGFVVFHAPLDTETTCERFTDCLQIMRTWSEANPTHHLLFVFVEPKDDFDAESIAGHYEELDAEILSVWPTESLLTPDDVRGDHPDLITAITTDGWPSVNDTRGKALFVLFDSDEHRDGYLARAPLLADKPMFVRGGLDIPSGGIVKIDDPVAEFDEVVEAIEAGLIVRTRADTDVVEPAAGEMSRLEAALESGAHLISTDIPAPVPEYDYEVEIPGGTPSRCNPRLAEPDCTSAAIESP